MPQFRRKRNRLPLDSYADARAYFLTITSAQRRRVFTHQGTVTACLSKLNSSSKRYGFSVLAYCFMPDHVHLLLIGDDDADLLRFVKDFKQRTGYAYRQANSKALWQKSYYDHVVRTKEDLREVARYIVGNPVRAALAATPADYPYSGSFVWGRSIVEA